MEDCDRPPPGWWCQFKPPDDAKSNTEVLQPFFDALERYPPDSKLHCAIRFGVRSPSTEILELSGIDKNASYWERWRTNIHSGLAMKYQPVQSVRLESGEEFSEDEWVSIVNAVTKCPVLEELEIEFGHDISLTTIEDLLSRLSALRVLGLRIVKGVSKAFVVVVAKSIRKISTLETLVLDGYQLEMDEILLLQLFPSVSQVEDQNMLHELLWECSNDDPEHLYGIFTALIKRNSRLRTIELHAVSGLFWDTDSRMVYTQKTRTASVSLSNKIKTKNSFSTFVFTSCWSYHKLIGIFEALQGNRHLKKLDMKTIPFSELDFATGVAMDGGSIQGSGIVTKVSQVSQTTETMRGGSIQAGFGVAKFGVLAETRISETTVVTMHGGSVQRSGVVAEVSKKSVDSRTIVGKLMDLIGQDFYLEEIVLSPDLPNEFERVEIQLKNNTMDALKGMELIKPQSSRIFLCGFPYAGKTQLRKTFGEKQAFIKVRKHKKIPRTSGIEVTRIDTEVGKIYLWDFGGQGDYHFLHDLFIPSNGESASSFVILCSLVEKKDGEVVFKEGKKEKFMLKRDEVIKEELISWLRFIISKSKISVKFKPFITLVFTHVDLAPKEEITSFKESLEVIVEALKLKFENSVQISFDHGKSVIDARAKKSVKPLLKGLANNAQKMLQDSPGIYAVCAEVEEILTEWNKSNPKRPLIKLCEFEELCQKSPCFRILNGKQVEDICKAIASALHDSGVVIYFQNLNFVVVRPNWFCHDIMGRILSLDAMSATLFGEEPVADENGFVKMEALKEILDGRYYDGSILKKKREVEGILVEDLIQVMKEMNLCYEVAADDSGLFIPATLRNKAECSSYENNMIKWQPSCSDLYFGYRLECEDQDQTILTQGFFSRVQVEFMKQFQANFNCIVKHNIISLRFDGKEVIVEYCGKSAPLRTYDHMDGYIDVLVKSSKSKAETLSFTKHHVLGLIKKVCYSPIFGYPGVLLVESILNPKYVENLSGFQDRKNQAIKVDNLIRDLQSKFTSGSEVPFNLDYYHEWPSPGGHHKAQDLLGDDEWQGLVNECYEKFAFEVATQRQNLKEVQAEVSDDDQAHDLTSGDANENDLEVLDPQFSILYKTINQRFDAVDEMSKQIFDKMDKNMIILSKMISKGMEDNNKLQKKLVLDISRNIEKLMDFSIDLKQCRVPRLMYFTDVSKDTWLVTSLVPGLKSVQLHLMCEHIEGIHLVNEQKGCELRLSSERFQSALPYVIWGVRAISLLIKIGGLAIAGMGSLVEGAEREIIKGLASSIPLNTVSSNLDEGCVTRSLLPKDLKTPFSVENQKAAEQWLVSFLSNKSIADLFDLHRIRYTSGSKRLAWVCGKHKREGEREKTMETVTVPA
ncbi:hypothetical protein KC19_11G087300 [Ceratodon purpureus]|uniref:COR domain-containing protein n=1 Tax=Ceratodon purpureus TaxID=3225 RepID=A0A8T0GD22_CERPU|nr:hypothetical protein KC19_11G087300 [Ceratodon purpureus]